MCRQLEPRAAPAAEPDAKGLCTPAEAQSAERSCAAPEAAQPPVAPVPLAARSQKLPEALPKPVPLVASPGVPEVRSRVRLQSALMLAVARQLDAQD